MSSRAIPTFFLLSALLLSSCALPGGGSSAPEPAQRQFFAMNTLMTLQITGEEAEDALSAAVEEVNRLDRLFSRSQSESDIARLNAHAGDGTDVPLSPETTELLSLALEETSATAGAFDVTVAPVIDAWGFGTGDAGQYRLPSEGELEALLPLVDSAALHVDTAGNTARLDRSGMEVDLGGIAKGYTADRLVELLGEYDVSSALLNLGSSTITLVGNNPSGQPWRVALKDPQDEEQQILLLSLSDQALSTSGAYEQHFEENGVTYHHILDPRTGYPAQTGILSVTVVSDNGARADALSTALFVAGPEQALELWRADDSFECVLCLEDGRILITQGLEDQFLYNEEDSHGYTCEIVRR